MLQQCTTRQANAARAPLTQQQVGTIRPHCGFQKNLPPPQHAGVWLAGLAHRRHNVLPKVQPARHKAGQAALVLRSTAGSTAGSVSLRAFVGCQVGCWAWAVFCLFS